VSHRILSLKRFLFLCPIQFEQFSRTVGNAAVDQQKEMRDGFVSFCSFYSQSAYEVNATWPIYALPNFEAHAGNMMKQTGVEILKVAHYIKDVDAKAALEYANQNYERWFVEGHMTRYGNLNRLNATKTNYHPYFTLHDHNGTRVPDEVQREKHYALWEYSPRTYANRTKCLYMVILAQK
jgi:hypothetical protein